MRFIIPFSFERLSIIDNPQIAALFFVVLSPAFFFLYLLYAGFRFLRALLKKKREKEKMVAQNHVQIKNGKYKILASIFVLLFYAGYFVPVIFAGKELIFGIPTFSKVFGFSSIAAMSFGAIGFTMFFVGALNKKYSFRKILPEAAFFLLLLIFSYYIIHWSII